MKGMDDLDWGEEETGVNGPIFEGKGISQLTSPTQLADAYDFDRVSTYGESDWEGHLNVAAAATRQAGGEAKCVRLGGALNESRQIDPRSKERKLPRETTASRRCE